VRNEHVELGDIDSYDVLLLAGQQVQDGLKKITDIQLNQGKGMVLNGMRVVLM
jgi:hypothetical protein